MAGLNLGNVGKPPEKTDEQKREDSQEIQQGAGLGENVTAPTAEDVGSDVEKIEHDPIAQEVAAIHAANNGVTGDSDGVTIFSSHPVQNYHLGRFHFENATLKVKGDDLVEFRELLDQQPAPERNQVRELEMSRVDDIIKNREAINGITDSGAGRAALERLRETTPKVGTVPLEDMSKPKLGFTSATGNDVKVVETDPEANGGVA